MNHIVEKYMLLVEKISNTVRMSKPYGTDVDIYRSEIHMIQLIGDHSELYISEISKCIGVTKGTISQIAKRLETKGLVKKFVDTANNTRQLVRLTPKGQTAYKSHCLYHQQKHREMIGFLNQLDNSQIAVLDEFLTHAQLMIEDHP